MAKVGLFHAMTKNHRFPLGSLRGLVGRLTPAPTPLNLPLLALLLQFGIVITWLPVLPMAVGYVAMALLGFATVLALPNWARTSLKWRRAYYGAMLIFSVTILGLSFLVEPWPEKIQFVGKLARLYGKLISAQIGSFLPWRGVIHPNTLGLFAAPFVTLQLAEGGGWLFAFLRGRSSKKGKVGWLALASLPFTGGLLLLSQSRGGYIAVAVGALFMLFWLLPLRWRWALLALVAVGAKVLWDNADLVLRGDFGTPGTLTFREEVWQYTLSLVHACPFTGIGFRALRARLPALYPPKIYRLFADANVVGGNLHLNAHNAYLQAAVDLGIPGLIAFLAVLGVSLWMWWRVWAEREQLWLHWGISSGVVLGLGGGLVAHITFGFFESNGPGMFIVGWLLIGLIVGLFSRRGCPETNLLGGNGRDLA